METLKNAERAAGFAMAAGDEFSPPDKRKVKLDANPWRPGEALLAHAGPRGPRFGDWLRGLASLFGRGAPA